MAKEKEIKINAAVDEAMAETDGNSSDSGDNDTETQLNDLLAGDSIDESVAEEIELTEEEKLRASVSELEDKLLRSAAEFENYKKRLARQRDDLIAATTERSLNEILEVVDNFERAFEHGNSDTDSFHDGMELIFNQLKEMLNKKGVRPIKAIGQKFDPELHEAMLQLASDDYEEGFIAMEMTKGYKIGNRVLRHSKVAVSTGKPDEKENN